MKEVNEIYCADCGKFILREERNAENEIKCTFGSYDEVYYDGTKDIFYCLDCAIKNGFEV